MGLEPHSPGRRSGEYTFGPIPRGAATADAGGMSVSETMPSPAPAPARDPAHVLFEHASDLLVAAQALRATAGVDGAQPAIAATFGCLESAVDALADAIGTLTDAAVQVDDDDARRLALQGADAAHLLRVARDVLGTIRDRVGAAAPDATRTPDHR